MNLVSLFKKTWSVLLVVGGTALSAYAAETLFSNYTLNVNETGNVGSLWVFSRGDIYSGMTLLNLHMDK